MLGFGPGDSFRLAKNPGIVQVRYLKQNSRRKDAVSEITLETMEALEVCVNFVTLVFLPRNGYLMTTNSTTTFFESLSEKY